MYNITCRTKARYNGFIINGSCVVALIVGGITFRGFHPFFVAIAFLQENPSCRYNRHSCYHRSFCYSLRHSLGKEPCLDPWINAIVDYSGANDYVEAHYRNHPLLQSSSNTTSFVPYFYREKSGGDKIREPIYNARELRILEEKKPLMTTTTTQPITTSAEVALPCHSKLLETYGMALVSSPTKVIDWKNRRHIEDVYIEELENILPTLFSSEIEMYCFWNPMLRGENHGLSPTWQQLHKDRKVQRNFDDRDDDDVHSIPTANVASVVHIDTDVGAYDSLGDFLAIVERNEVKRRGDQDVKSFDRKQYQYEITENRKRFAVVNFWRSTSRVIPVTTSPLAILSTRYEQRNSVTTITETNFKQFEGGKNSYKISAFPNSRPDFEQSKWYTFPNMTSDEVLVFYQYDRLVTQPSDLWHCAISVEHNRAQDTEANSNIDSKRVKAPRESFDIRALIVFDEIVHNDKDRFHPERVRPELSFEESGCFCDKQAIKRTL